MLYLGGIAKLQRRALPIKGQRLIAFSTPTKTSNPSRFLPVRFLGLTMSAVLDDVLTGKINVHWCLSAVKLLCTLDSLCDFVNILPLPSRCYFSSAPLRNPALSANSLPQPGVQEGARLKTSGACISGSPYRALA